MPAGGDVRKCGFACFGAFSSKNEHLLLAKFAIIRTRNRYFRFFSGSSTPKPYVEPGGWGAGPVTAIGDVAKCGFWDFRPGGDIGFSKMHQP